MTTKIMTQRDSDKKKHGVQVLLQGERKTKYFYLHGVCKRIQVFYPTGVKKQEFRYYANGQKRNRLYDLEGVLYYDAKYSGEVDHKTGCIIKYHDNGQKMSERWLKDGRFDGVQSLWDECGNLIYAKRYDNGKLTYKL